MTPQQQAAARLRRVQAGEFIPDVYPGQAWNCALAYHPYWADLRMAADGGETGGPSTLSGYGRREGCVVRPRRAVRKSTQNTVADAEDIPADTGVSKQRSTSESGEMVRHSRIRQPRSQPVLRGLRPGVGGVAGDEVGYFYRGGEMNQGKKNQLIYTMSKFNSKGVLDYEDTKEVVTELTKLLAPPVEGSFAKVEEDVGRLNENCVLAKRCQASRCGDVYLYCKAMEYETNADEWCPKCRKQESHWSKQCTK